MEESEIEEGNKLITKFKYNGFVSTKVTDWIEGFPYHKDWNLLMPIVEKIELLDKWEIDIFGKECEFLYNRKFQINGINYHEGDKLKSTYKAVVEFIKWYNKNTKAVCNLCQGLTACSCEDTNPALP